MLRFSESPIMIQTAAFGYEVPTHPRKLVVTTGEGLECMERQLLDAKVICFDHETSGLNWWGESRSVGLALACPAPNGESNFCWYVPYGHATGENQLPLAVVRPSISKVLDSPAVKVAHNFKFDLHFSRKTRFPVRKPWFCTQMGARLYDENLPLALKKRAVTDLGISEAETWEKKLDEEVRRLSKARRVGIKAYRAKYGYSEVSIPLAGFYACHDVDFALQLYHLYEHRWGVSRHCSCIWSTEMDLLEVLADMEEWGSAIDVDYLEQLRDVLGGVVAGLEDRLSKMLGSSSFNWGSDKELAKFLREGLKLTLTKRTRTGAFAVDAEVLNSLRGKHPSIPLILEWREAEKIRTTYTSSILEKLDDKNILHGELMSDGTNTGRMASKKPNLHNFPADSNERAKKLTGKSLDDGGWDPWSIRRAFVVRHPHWPRLFLDYSQIELRMIAYYTRDPIMLDTYAKGGDIHDRTAKEVGALIDGNPLPRRVAKVVNFGISYCLTPMGLARQAGISLDQADLFLTRFLERYGGIPRYREHFWQQCRLAGNRFSNAFGRPRYLPDLMSQKDWERSRAERRAFGTLIQGTAAELTKQSLVWIHQFLKSRRSGARLVSTVHDEIWIDCPIGHVWDLYPSIKTLMERYPKFDPIPILVDGQITHTNWAEKRPIEKKDLAP